MPAGTPSPLCPSCDRYIGPSGICPYCNASATKSPMLRTIRVTAILLATAGLALLYAAARHSSPPLVRISEITPVMNFAHIRVVGTINRKTYISTDRAYVGFTVDDGSGHLRVAAYRDVARALVEEARLPTAGDRVEVRGSLSVTAEDEPKLYLKAADHLMINPGSENPTS